MAGSDRVAVDALRRYLLPLAALQGLVDAHHQRPVRDERLHERLEEQATRFRARPLRAAQDPMVAMESLVSVQTHRAQGGAHRPFSRGEDRARQQYLDVLEDTLGEQWREGVQNPYHSGW